MKWNKPKVWRWVNFFLDHFMKGCVGFASSNRSISLARCQNDKSIKSLRVDCKKKYFCKWNETSTKTLEFQWILSTEKRYRLSPLSVVWRCVNICDKIISHSPDSSVIQQLQLPVKGFLNVRIRVEGNWWVKLFVNEFSLYLCHVVVCLFEFLPLLNVISMTIKNYNFYARLLWCCFRI